MYNKNFVYYQPNKLDVRDKYGDCTIRALSKVFDCTWLEAFDRQIPLCRKYQVSNIFDAPAEIRNKFFEELGFKYVGVSNRRGMSRPTIAEFANSHKEGVYIVTVRHHVVAVVNGKYYDTWDSGNQKMYGWYELI